MAEKWVISDTHFGHANIIKFTKPDGSPIRPGFTAEPMRAFTPFRDIQHHDETLIARYNARVGTHDTVYFFGDFGKPLNVCERLNGRKKLILGNHDDIHDARDLRKYFYDIVAWRVSQPKDGFPYPVVFTHFPLHADERKPATRRIQVHGHIHEKTIEDANGQPDPWYVNICVEHTNHAPLHWDDLVKIVGKRHRILKDRGLAE